MAIFLSGLDDFKDAGANQTTPVRHWTAVNIKTRLLDTHVTLIAREISISVLPFKRAIDHTNEDDVSANPRPKDIDDKLFLIESAAANVF